jgi:hypothetical protein
MKWNLWRFCFVLLSLGLISGIFGPISEWSKGFLMGMIVAFWIVTLWHLVEEAMS